MVCMLSSESLEGAETMANSGDLGVSGTGSIGMDEGRQKDIDIHHPFTSPSRVLYFHLHYTDQ